MNTSLESGDTRKRLKRSKTITGQSRRDSSVDELSLEPLIDAFQSKKKRDSSRGLVSDMEKPMDNGGLFESDEISCCKEIDQLHDCYYPQSHRGSNRMSLLKIEAGINLPPSKRMRRSRTMLNAHDSADVGESITINRLTGGNVGLDNHVPSLEDIPDVGIKSKRSASSAIKSLADIAQSSQKDTLAASPKIFDLQQDLIPAANKKSEHANDDSGNLSELDRISPASIHLRDYPNTTKKAARDSRRASSHESNAETILPTSPKRRGRPKSKSKSRSGVAGVLEAQPLTSIEPSETPLPNISNTDSIPPISTPLRAESYEDSHMCKTPTGSVKQNSTELTTPTRATKKGPSQHSPLPSGKVPYRVGLSKRSRIAPLLRVIRK
jgi:hypothetical protein